MKQRKMPRGFPPAEAMRREVGVNQREQRRGIFKFYAECAVRTAEQSIARLTFTFFKP